MDASNIAHFCFSFTIPICWVVILRPFSRTLFKSWRGFMVSILILSLAAMVGKEFFDKEFGVNDIICDVLGFFMGITLISDHFYRREKTLNKSEEREVAGQKISIRSTLSLIEKIEMRSASFYRMAARKAPDPRTSGICILLARDARKRARKVAFSLLAWKSQPEMENLTEAVENAFSAQHLFSLDIPPSSTPKEILQIALDHEKKKFSLFSKLEEVFQEEWKKMQLGAVRTRLSKKIAKLELCLSELEKAVG